MNIILAGGSGLIGNRLVQALSKSTGTIWVLSRHPNERKALPGVKLVAWDGRTPAGWEQLVNEADVIINLAGENIGARLWSTQRKQQILESRINSGRAIMEAIRRADHKPGVLVQASAVGYYGPSGDEPITEANAAGIDFVAQVCVAWEASTQEVEGMGVRRVIIRTGLVTEPEGTFMSRLALPIRFFIGGPLGSGRQWFSWIHPEDVVGAILFLIGNAESQGAYNLTAPNPLTDREFGRLLAGILHRPFWIPVPALALRLALGEMSQIVLTGQRAIPQRLQAAGYPFRYPQAKTALQHLYGNRSQSLL